MNVFFVPLSAPPELAYQRIEVLKIIAVFVRRAFRGKKKKKKKTYVFWDGTRPEGDAYSSLASLSSLPPPSTNYST